MWRGTPQVPDLGIPEEKYCRIGQNLIGGLAFNLKSGRTCGQLEQGHPGRENIGCFGGRDSHLNVRRIDQQFCVIGRRRVNILVRFTVMPRCKKGSQVNKHSPFASEADDIVRLEIYEDDAVLMKPLDDGQRFIDGFLEFTQPLVRVTAHGSRLTPGLEILALQKFHGDESVFLIVIDIGSVISRNKRSQILHPQNVPEVCHFKAKAHVGSVADLVRFAAA